MAQGNLFARRLLTGEAGCGKSHAVLALYLNAWRNGQAAETVLVVPTLSFREHTRNALLRMNPGALLEGRGIVTLEALLSQAPDFPASRRDLIVERVLRDAAIPYFAPVRDFPGFRAALADEADQAIEQGVSLRQDSTRARAFSGFVGRYARATAQFRRSVETTAAPRLLLVDGFADFTLAQKQVLATLAGRAAETVVTLPLYSDVAREMLARELGFVEERLTGDHRPAPAPRVMVSHDRRDEVDYVASEVLRLVREHGYQYREIGVIVQNPEAYLRTIADVFRGRGIPARMFFPVNAGDTSLGRHLLACLAWMRSAPEEQNNAALAVLKSAWSPSAREDVARMEFDVASGKLSRMVLPAVTPSDSHARTIVDAWESLTYFPELTPAADHARVLELRADALMRRRAWEIPGEVAEALRAEGVTLDFAAFVALVERELLRLRFRVRDRRTDTVNVMNAYEARQWELRAVFVVGMVEGEFPRRPRSPLFLPDTSAEQTREQENLYAVATTRAREYLTLSYPHRDARGVKLTPSRFVVEPATPCPVSVVSPPTLEPMPRYVKTLARDTTFSPSSLKSFNDCAFKHFAAYRMHLEGRPRQEKGLTHLLQGTIVHETIMEWDRGGRHEALPAILERVFTRATHNLPIGHDADKIHAAMLRDLAAFEKFESTRRDTYRTVVDPDYVEKKFDFPLILPDGAEIRITGRVDRVELRDSDEGKIALAVDYKYRAKPYTKKPLEEAVTGEYQAAAYLLALEHWDLRPAGIEFHNLRGDARRVGLLDKELSREVLNVPPQKNAMVQPVAGVMSNGRERMIAAAVAIRAGLIAVEPADTGRCHYGQGGCDFYDLCRIPKGQIK